jgi:hypothetical protein
MQVRTTAADIHVQLSFVLFKVHSLLVNFRQDKADFVQTSTFIIFISDILV